MTKKEYNQRFYAKNKEKIIENACEKKTCNLCFKIITKNIAFQYIVLKKVN